jgi:gas vesicle protein
MKAQHGFFCGLALGVMAGILFAPHSGSKTRGMILLTAKDGQATLKRKGEAALDTAAEAMERGRTAAQKTASGIARALETGRRSLAG